ncbi:MAG: VWA domain-containing protein, partial [Desulfovibrio sp.]|nr:VWA domain-containing protein [Desulfovibrio sp.]
MRKLPVYFLIDVSESMAGDQIREVENGIHYILKELRGNPYALETVYIGVIGFAGKAKTLVPLTELIQFNAPVLPLGSGTDLGAGLTELMKEMDASVQKTTPQKKGDWKPIVFLFTDGAPTHDPAKAVNRWSEHYRGHCALTTIIFGDNADVELLRLLGNDVYRMTDLSRESFREFFKWISSSVGMSSMAVAQSHIHI